MLDFSQLNDPEARERAAQRQREREEAFSAKLAEIATIIDFCFDARDRLKENERSLVHSCRARKLQYLLPTESQEKWLRDIYLKLSNKPAAAHTEASPRKTVFNKLKGKP